MKFRSKILLGLTLAISLSSCSKFDEPETETLHLSAASTNANPNLTPQEKAEELSHHAETLLAENGIEPAYDVAALALKNDPQNLRAQFIHNFLKILILQKGLVTRIEPLAQNDPASLQSYEKLVLRNKNGEVLPWQKLMYLDAPKDIGTEAALQTHIDKSYVALNEFRLFLKNRKDEELTIKAFPLLVNDMEQRFVDGCEIKITEAYEYDLICPPNRTRFEVTLNRADFKIFQTLASYVQQYLLMLNTYDLSGMISFKHWEQVQKSISTQEIYDHFMKEPMLGRARIKPYSGEFGTLGLDTIGELRWALDRQDELCVGGYNNARNRIGMYANRGLCVYSMLKPYLSQYEALLTGGPTQIRSEQGAEPLQSNVNIAALFDHPVAQLQSIGPFKFDACGNLESVRAPTLGGMLPKGDANAVLTTSRPKCARP